MHLHPEALFLVQAVILIGTPSLLWQLRVVRSVAPLVVIQVLLGICLGPTVLGRLFPELHESLFPKDSLVILNGIAWLGLSFFGFLTGLHFELKTVAKRGYAFAATSLSTLAIPMLCGAMLALVFYREPFIDANTDKWLFVIGIASAIGVTALPVLSAILIDTELIGIHYVFGAFVFGAMLPAEVRSGLYKAFEEFTMVALMPFYFILTGLKTSFAFDNTVALQLFLAATFVAVVSKVAGTALPERVFMKSSRKTAVKAGILMQTKGLMEIVVLNILLAHGIINTTVFSALVLMAVVTTFLTKPSMLLAHIALRALPYKTNRRSVT